MTSCQTKIKVKLILCTVICFIHVAVGSDIPSQRCTSGNEPPLYKLVESDGSDDCCDTWEFLGSETGCHFHPFTKREVLDYCVVQQSPRSSRKAEHIILYGGSTHYGVAMAILKLLAPTTEYPIENPTDWYKCLEPCDLLNRGSRTINFFDVVVSREDGSILSQFALQDEDMVSKGDGGLRLDHAERVGPLLAQASASIPASADYLRVTYAKVRYYSAVVPVTEFILARAPAVDQGMSPSIVVGIRSQWYQYCWDGFSWCPRDDLRGLPEEQVKEQARQSAQHLARQVAEGSLPGSTRLVIVEDEWNAWLNDMARDAVAPFPALQRTRLLLLRAAGSRHQGGSSNTLLRYDGHPINKKNALLALSYVGVLCPTAGPSGDVATRASLTFDSPGCLPDPTREAEWMDHYLAPCGYSVALAIPPTPPPTQQPTPSPTLPGDTARPSASPTSAAPTASPTTAAEISTVVEFPDHWATPTNLSRFLDPGEPNKNHVFLEPPAQRQVFHPPPLVTAHYALAVLSAVAALAWAAWGVVKSGAWRRLCASEEKPAVVAGKGHLAALGPARYVASVHIVAGHVAAKRGGYIDRAPTHGFGFTWVPWFLMLSGFILTHAHMARKKKAAPLPWYRFVLKRVRSVYPLYMVGLFAAAGIASLRDESAFSLSNNPKESVLWQLGETVSVLGLLQAWIPIFTESVFQAHCWFLSCIILYWAVHNWVLERIKNWETRGLVALAISISLLPWLFLVALPLALGHPVSWHQGRTDGGRVVTGLDVIVVMLKFHPLFYFHIYLQGMVLALLHHRRGEWVSSTPPNERQVGIDLAGVVDLCWRWGTVIGYTLLYLVFATLPSSQYNSTKLLFRLGGLAPLHSLVLVGCTMGSDPVAATLAHPLLRPLGDISFPQYVFQFIVFSIWGTETGVGFWFLLSAFSIAGFHFVQDPLKDARAPKTRQVLGVLGGIALVLAALGAFAAREHSFAAEVGSWDRWRPVEDQEAVDPWYQDVLGQYHARLAQLEAVPAPPDDVEYSRTAFDRRLFLADQRVGRQLGTGEAFRLINPSLLVSNGSVLFAVRRHRLEVLEEEGTFSAEDVLDTDEDKRVEVVTAERRVTTSWTSEVVLGELVGAINGSFGAGLTVVPRGIVGADASPRCTIRPLYSSSNSTLMRFVTQGWEDPRLFLSATPLIGRGALALTVFESGGYPLDGAGNCARASQPLPSRMLVHSLSCADDDSSADECSEAAGTAELRPALETGKVEKNWMAFWSEQLEETLFVQHLEPLVILRYKGDTDTWNEYLVRSDPRFRKLDEDGFKIHGGANFVPYPNSPAQGQAMLSVFHTVSPSGEYTNYAFELITGPRVRLGRVSKPLPLLLTPVLDSSLSNRIAFCSGVVLLPGDSVAFTYGSSNAQARVLVLSSAELELLFAAPVVRELTASPSKAPTSFPSSQESRSPTPSPTRPPSPRPSMAPVQEPTAPEVGLADFGERCSETAGSTYPQCVETAMCVEVTNWSKCIDCNPVQYQRDCKYWGNEDFVSRAAELCGSTCLESGR